MAALRIQRADLALFFAALLLSFLLAEGLLRLLFPAPRYGYVLSPPQEYFFQYDARLGWRGRPLAEGDFSGDDFRVRVRHNAAGHRSSTRPHVEGKRNVLVLGDSLAWGWGVEDHQIFSERMMAIDRRLNVYNLAAAGYGTGQELLAFEELLAQHPGAAFDDVVLIFFTNDFRDVVEEERYSYPKPRFHLQGGELRLRNVPVPETARAAFDERREGRRLALHPLRRLHLANLTDFALDIVRWRIEAKRNGIAWQAPANEGEWQVESLALTSRLIREMAERSRQRGASFTAVLVRPGREHLWGWLARELEAAGIAAPVFEGRSYLRRTDLWLDRHLNGYGHRLLAEKVLRELPEVPLAATASRVAAR